MKDSLTALSARLAKLVQDWPQGVPIDLVEIEIRRVDALAEMVGEGLAD